MRVPLSWLKTYIDLPADLSGVFDTCDMAGLEIAGVEVLGAGWDHIVVGRIVEVAPIEGAHVQRVRVDVGTAEHESACGAPNVDQTSLGRHVVVALPGATVRGTGPNGEVVPITVSARKVKGFESSVVLCSEREVGLSDDHSGLLYLGDDTVVGRPLADALGDKVVEIELTPDLGRCFSIYGTARELSALTRAALHPEALERADVGAAGAGSVSVRPIRIETPDLCNRYLGAVIRNVTVGESPAWMQQRLLACGMRPINVVVDIANYVMIEMGQPLHFFDLARLAGAEIVVRLATAGEKMLALNGDELALLTDTLVIADKAGPVAVAGVIGGKDSAVSAETTDVLLEAAHFDYRSIRRTTQKLKLRTDAAERFIKDVDPEWTFEAMRRAVHLLLTLVPGATLEGYRDAYPVHAEAVTVPISAREVDRLLGVLLPDAEIRRILEGFAFTVKETEGGLLATAPTWRKDVAVAADLVEEVARAIGMNNIAPALTAPVYLGQKPYASEGLLSASRELGAVLRGSGFDEVVNYAIVSKAWNRFRTHYALRDGVASVHLANPLSKERDAMRTTLLPALLRNVADNLRYSDGAQLYELGRAYFRTPEGVWEPNVLAAVSTGRRRGAFWGESAPGTAFGADLGLFDLLGIVQAVAAKLGVTLATRESPSDDLTPGKSMTILLGDRAVGGIGEVGPAWLAQMDLEGRRILALELHLDPLLDARPTETFFRRLPTQPAVYRDLSLLVEKRIPVADVLETARDAAGDLLLDLRLFDRYEGEGVPDGAHSLALSLTFQDPSRTLQADEVQQRVDAVVGALQEKHGATLRA